MTTRLAEEVEKRDKKRDREEDDEEKLRQEKETEVLLRKLAKDDERKRKREAAEETVVQKTPRIQGGVYQEGGATSSGIKRSADEAGVGNDDLEEEEKQVRGSLATEAQEGVMEDDIDRVCYGPWIG